MKYIPPPGQAQKIKRFNELVGNRTGRPARVGKAVTQPEIKRRRKLANQGAGSQAISAWVSHGGGKVPASIRSGQKAWLGTGTPFSAANVVSNTNQVFDQIYNSLTNEYNKQIRDENAARTAYASSVLNQQVNPEAPRELPAAPAQEKIDPKYGTPVDEKDNLKLGPSIDEQFLGGNAAKYIMDPLSRGIATVPTAATRGLQAGLESREGGESIGERLGAVVSGAASGFVEPLRSADPEHRKGWGDFYEAYQTGSPDPLARGLRNLEKNHPLIEEQISRLAGLSGDIFLDPVGKYIGAEKTGVIGGERATSESMRNFSKQMADEAAARMESDVITGAPKGVGGYRPYGTEAANAHFINESFKDFLDTAEYEVNGGGSKGRYEVLNRHMTSQVAGATGAQAIQDAFTANLDDAVQKVVDGVEGRGVKLNGPSLQAYADVYPDVGEWLDETTRKLIDDGRVPSNASVDEVANALNKGDVADLRTHQQTVIDNRYTPFVKEMQDEIVSKFKNSYYNTPGIRIGKKVIPVKAVGKAFATIEDKVFGGKVAENFRYNATFPGSLSLDTTRARAWGVVGMEQFEKDLRGVATQFTKDERRQIQHAIEHNTGVPAHLQAAKQWIQDQYKWMYDRELTAGARGRRRFGGPIDPYDPNYAHVQTRGKSVEDRTGFKDSRKKEIHSNIRAGKHPAAGRFKTENAAAEGLRPVDDAFEALHQRRLKHNRDMTRAHFRQDLVEKYGFTSRLSKAGQGFAAHERNLSQVEFHRLPEHIRQVIENTGEEMFLPREMYDSMNEFERITKWNGASQQQVVRQFTKISNLLKRLQTLPWPGFHNKNIIGDVFMSLLDNVNFDDYAWTFKKFLEKKAGRKAEWEIVPGLKTNFEREWDTYQREANSGFVSSELGGLASPTKYNIPKRALSSIEKKVQSWSGYREDAGRFTHYTAAYKQEAKALWKKGERDLATIDRKARSAALWRVNNYKFDYNALSLWEKKTKTLAFPFYTFMRKAAPTMMQALYQDPRWMVQWYNFLYQGSEGEKKTFDSFRIPQSIRDAGYAFLPGQANEDQPLYVTNDILPTSIFSSIKTSSPHELANSVLTQANPMAQAIIEQATGKQLFMDKPLDKNQSFAEYMLSKVPGSRETDQFFDSSRPWSERLLSSRIGLGLPIRRLRENQQLFAEQELQDRMLDEPIANFNKSQDRFYISREASPNGQAEVFTVKNNFLLDQYGHPTPIQSFYTPQEAIDFARKKLPSGYKKQPTTLDVNNQQKVVRRPVNG